MDCCNTYPRPSLDSAITRAREDLNKYKVKKTRESKKKEYLENYLESITKLENMSDEDVINKYYRPLF